MAARSAKRSRDSNVAGKDYSNEESSSDDDNDDNFAVDWRAQHLWEFSFFLWVSD